MATEHLLKLSQQGSPCLHPRCNLHSPYTTACFNTPIVKPQKAEGPISAKIHYSGLLLIHLNTKLLKLFQKPFIGST